MGHDAQGIGARDRPPVRPQVAILERKQLVQGVVGVVHGQAQQRTTHNLLQAVAGRQAGAGGQGGASVKLQQ